MRRLTFTRPVLIALATLWGLSSTSCIVSEPKELETQEQIPPRVLYDKVDPPLNAIWQIHENDDNRLFTVPFVSEDVGENVLGRLFLNYGFPGEVFLGSASEESGTSEDLDRTMRVRWNNSQNQDYGCYVFTMTISHSSNYPSEGPDAANSGPIDLDKAAIVSWVVAYGDGPESYSLEDCPQSGDSMVAE